MILVKVIIMLKQTMIIVNHVWLDVKYVLMIHLALNVKVDILGIHLIFVSLYVLMDNSMIQVI